MCRRAVQNRKSNLDFSFAKPAPPGGVLRNPFWGGCFAAVSMPNSIDGGPRSMQKPLTRHSPYVATMQSKGLFGDLCVFVSGGGVVRPEIVDFGSIPGPTWPGGGLGEAPAGAPSRCTDFRPVDKFQGLSARVLEPLCVCVGFMLHPPFPNHEINGIRRMLARFGS